jgi:hypothetical protein
MEGEKPAFKKACKKDLAGETGFDVLLRPLRLAGPGNFFVI